RAKVLNDAEKKIQALAETHGRNARAAVLTVAKAANYTAAEALKNKLVDYVSPSLPTLLNTIDGTTVRGGKGIVLHTANAQIETDSMPFTLVLLNILIDPNLLFLLFLAGIGGIGYEVFHPGVILPGTLGAVCLILALFGFSVVPVNYAGIALIIFGVALLITEAYVTSHGLIALSGIVSLAAGGLLLFRTPGNEMGVSPWVILTISALFGGTLATIATKVVAARHQPPSAHGAGAQGLVGEVAVVRAPLEPRGQVFVHGELWQAELDGGGVDADGRADIGDRVVVRRVDGLTLHVVCEEILPTEGA
ncbi:MAG: NfeD family protein, partial [Gaiellales bacterium]